MTMLYDEATTDEPETATGPVAETDGPSERASAREPGDDEGDRVSIGKDDAFHLLQNGRRRAVCRYLLARPNQQQFRMGDIVEAVAAWENDTTVEQLTPEQRQRVYVSLYQSHLPKLDAHDVIEYDTGRRLVEPTPLLAVFSRFLDPGLPDETRALTPETDGVDRIEENESGATLLPNLSTLFERRSEQ